MPLFQMFSRLGLIDTHWPLILVPIFGAPSVLATFIMRQFFIDPADRAGGGRPLDGLGRFGIFRRIALPLARPALGRSAIFTFLAAGTSTWNRSVYLSSKEQVHAAAGAHPVHRRRTAARCGTSSSRRRR